MGPHSTGTIDAAVMGEPFLAVLKNNDVRILVDPMAGRAASGDRGLVHDAAIRPAQSGADQALCRVMYDTARWANTPHTDSARILLKCANCC